VTTPDYLTIITNRLVNKDFKQKFNVNFKHYLFPLVASKNMFSFLRGGVFHREIIFSHFNKPDILTLKNFSSVAYRHTNKTYGLLPPRGLGYSTQCFAVAITNQCDGSVIKVVESHNPPKHWAASEVLVIFEQDSQQIHYYKTSPPWGSLYHEDNRSFISNILIPFVDSF
jgi:hypothetical protein